MRFREGEETLACDRKRVDQQDTDREKWLQQNRTFIMAVKRAGCLLSTVLENSNRHPHQVRMALKAAAEPRPKEIPYFGRFRRPFRREDAIPAKSCRSAASMVARHRSRIGHPEFPQGKAGAGIVEYLEGKQSTQMITPKINPRL
jgi:hypothetical protein